MVRIGTSFREDLADAMIHLVSWALIEIIAADSVKSHID
jgi:hypothetical protein